MRINELQEKVGMTISKYNLIQKNDIIIIGVSGGPDSMTLLDILDKLKNKFEIKLIVAHINHMLRKEADIEEEFVKENCKKRNISFFAEKIDINRMAQKKKIGLEEAGRMARYNFFDEIRKKTNANKIALAHQANDNAETILMHLIRGSGSLKGIAPMREGIYIRPLIEITREEIEEYCNEMNLSPKTDQSNNENIYTRNKIRNLLIPYIEKNFNPGIVHSLNRYSLIEEEKMQYIKKHVQEAYIEVLEEKNKKIIILNLKKFNKLEKVIKSEILRHTIIELIGTINNIEKKNIDDIIKLCANNIGNKQLKPNKSIKIEINHGKIFLESVN